MVPSEAWLQELEVPSATVEIISTRRDVGIGCSHGSNTGTGGSGKRRITDLRRPNVGVWSGASGRSVQGHRGEGGCRLMVGVLVCQVGAVSWVLKIVAWVRDAPHSRSRFHRRWRMLMQGWSLSPPANTSRLIGIVGLPVHGTPPAIGVAGVRGHRKSAWWRAESAEVH